MTRRFTPPRTALSRMATPRMAPPPGGFSLEGRASDEARRAGRAGFMAGANFEAALARGHELDQAAGRACVAHVGERTIGRPGAVVRVGGGQVDFVGVARRDDGQVVPVAFDAKTTTGKATLAMRSLAPTMKPKDVARIARQIAWMRDFERVGGRAWYACYDADVGAEGAVFLVPARALQVLVDDVAAGAVLIRALGRDAKRTVTSPWPIVWPSTLAEVSRGRPLWDWRAVLE